MSYASGQHDFGCLQFITRHTQEIAAACHDVYASGAKHCNAFRQDTVTFGGNNDRRIAVLGGRHPLCPKWLIGIHDGSFRRVQINLYSRIQRHDRFGDLRQIAHNRAQHRLAFHPKTFRDVVDGLVGKTPTANVFTYKDAHRIPRTRKPTTSAKVPTQLSLDSLSQNNFSWKWALRAPPR